MHRFTISLVSLVGVGTLAFLPAAPATAQIFVTNTPFAGAVTETFEGFPNYQNGGTYFGSNPIFGGAGTLSANGDYLIYEPGVADVQVSTGVTAQTSDGTKALRGSDSGQTFTISLTTPQNVFGGYFDSNGATGTSSTDLLFDFSFGGTSVGSSAQTINVNNGVLSFLGFTSVSPFDAVAITATNSGTLVFADGLRIGVVAVPEAGSAWLALVGVPVALVAVRRRKK